MPQKGGFVARPKRRFHSLLELVEYLLDDRTSPELRLLMEAVVDDLPTLLHWGMFVPNIKSLCDVEQDQELAEAINLLSSRELLHPDRYGPRFLCER